MNLKDFVYVAVLVSLVLSSSTAFSEPNKPNDDAKFTIEPRVGMGKLHFGMSREEMIKILGKPQSTNGENINNYPEFCLTVVIRDRVVSSIFCGFDPAMVKKCKCTTTKGIRMGSTKQQIIAAYGEPSKVTDQNGLTTLRYKGILTDFSLRDDKVVAIYANSVKTGK